MSLQRLVWSITNKCNFNCAFCYASSGPKEPLGVSTSEALSLVEKINNSSISTISIIGGEPFIRDDLRDIISAISPKISIGIDTNGSLVREKWHSIYEEKIERICIGFDGPPEINSVYRKQSEKVVETIKWLISKNVKVVITVLVSSQNYHKLAEISDYLIKLGVKQIQFNKYFPVFGRNNAQTIQMSKEQEDIAISSIISLISKQKSARELIQFSTWYNTKHFDTFRKEQKLGSCFCGIWSAAIAYDGSIVPCLHITQKNVLNFFKTNTNYEIPNIRTHDIRMMPTESQLFKDLSSAAVGLLPDKCSTCRFSNRCSHGCKVDAFLESNNWNGDPPFCNLTKEECDE